MVQFGRPILNRFFFISPRLEELSCNILCRFWQVGKLSSNVKEPIKAGVVIRSVELYDVVKIKATESEAEQHIGL